MWILLIPSECFFLILFTFNFILLHPPSSWNSQMHLKNNALGLTLCGWNYSRGMGHPWFQSWCIVVQDQIQTSLWCQKRGHLQNSPFSAAMPWLLQDQFCCISSLRSLPLNGCTPHRQDTVHLRLTWDLRQSPLHATQLSWWSGGMCPVTH